MLGKSKFKSFLQFKHNPRLLKIATNTGWLFADRLLRMVGGLLVGVWVARYLGTQQYGLFNYVFAFVSLLLPIATLGLDNVVVRHLVKQTSDQEEILGTAFGLKVIGGIVLWLMAVTIMFFLEQGQSSTISIVAILALTGIFQSLNVVDLWFQSQVQSKYSVIAKNSAYLCNTLLKVILILIKAPLLAFVWATLAEVVMSAVGLTAVYWIKGNAKFAAWKWNSQQAKELLRESYPLIFSGFAILIFMKIDQIMLGQISGDREVGIYSAAVKVSELWYFIPGAIVSSVAPSIYAAKEKSEAHYYKRIGQLLRLLTAIALVIAVPMTFFAGNIILLMFGNEYIEAGTILSVHIWASLFVFMGFATSPWFIAEGLNHISLGKTLFGAVLNIILNLVLIPKHGGMGAASATIVSQAMAAFLCNTVDRRTRKLFFIQVESLLPFKLNLNQ